MSEQARHAYRKRSIALALVAVAIWGLFSFFLPWVAVGSKVLLFGLPLGTALAVPVGLPILVLTMFWIATRQNGEDEQFPGDD